MTKWIAHRGNLTGPNPSMENNPDYVFEAIKKGFDVEIDVWRRKDAAGLSTWWLGHDEPLYQVEFSFLKNAHVWCHAKDFETYRVLQDYNLRAFFQTREVYVTTSNGYMWWHQDHSPYADASKKYSILTALSIQDEDWFPEGYYGLCTDYAKHCRDGKPAQVEAKPVTSAIINPFDIFFLDVDGVLASHKVYDYTHEVIRKEFVDKDFTAIKRMKAAGVEVVILSGDKWNEGMAMNRKIQFIHTSAQHGVIDKLPYAETYACERGVSFDRCAYVGDDYYDISLLEKVGFAYCPHDAIKDVKAVAYVLDHLSGEGCIAEIYDRLEWNETYPYDFL